MNELSPINAIFKKMETLSLFELSRLRYAISILIEDPARNAAVRRNLKLGMSITYFDNEKNDLVEATILDIRRTKASVINKSDGIKWTIGFDTINLEGIDTSIASQKSSGKLDRNSLKIGSYVGFKNRVQEIVYGVIEKLNPKRALVKLDNGQRWNVTYPCLFLVVDGHTVKDDLLCIEGEVVR
jgi:hypothetical protein